MGIIKKLNIEDTYVDSNSKQENFRFSEKLKLGKYGEADNIGALIFYKVLNLKDIPENANIINAYLHLYQTDGSEDIATVRTYSPQVNWKKEEIVWDNKPQLNKNLVQYDRINDINGWKVFTITEFIQRWIIGAATNFGLVMKLDVAYGGEFEYYSSEFEDTQFQPYIEVEYELPCNPPINLEPFENRVINLEKINKFSWTYIPSYKGDSQQSFKLRYSYDKSDWDYLSGSTNNFYNVPANTFKEGQIYWQVKVKNQQNNWSQYSNIITINATKKPTSVVIVTPNLINVFRPSIAWTSTNQYSFILEIRKLDNTLLWSSKKVISAISEYEIGIDLENKTSYKIKIKIINKYGLESDWSEKIITTNFQTPNKPKVYLLQENEGKGITIRVVNNNTGIRIIRNEVFRKEIGKDFIRIGKIGLNGSYTDYAVKSGKTYKYYIRAIGETLGYVNSVVKSTSIQLRNSIITDTLTNKFVELIYNPQRTQNINLDKYSFKFAGRKHKITEFGATEDTTMDLNFSAINVEVLEKLIAIYKSNNILLYRDNRGRKMFCTMNNFKIKDMKCNLYEIRCELSQEDYSEEVT